MAEEVAVAAVGEIVKKLIDQIVRQFSYLVSYTSNIKSLQDGVQDLENTKDGMMLRFNAAKRNLKKVGKTGNDWLDKVEENEKMAQEILKGTKIVKDGCMKGWCPNLKQRYSLSRKAVKQIVLVKELNEEGKTFTEEQLFDPTLPAGMVASSSITGLEVFESRISMTNKVINALKNESISMVGICGLGGIGKSRMAKEIRERALIENNFFDAVAKADVSQNPNLKKIQDQLAVMLGLKLEENESVGDRGEKLRERLTQGSRILVILDDLWDELDLWELGIPVRSQGEANGCKVLITSRNEHVCNKMGTLIFSVQLLSEEEAWDLFKQKAGDCVETFELRPVAEKVLNECGRLPLSIITVAGTLKGRRMHDWKDALHQLQRCESEEMNAKVYASLRLSYDYLDRRGSSKKKEGNQRQQLFRLCCIFPEDADIPVEVLVRFSVGLRFLNDVPHLESARNRVQSLVDHLKSCHLLEHSDDEECVKMHDVVRDFGVNEPSNGERVHMVRHEANLKEWPQSDAINPTAISISSEENLELPPGLDYPLLRLLLIMAEGSIHVSADYFRGMKELRVLAIYGESVSFGSGTKLLEYQAKDPEIFMNVRTLCLERCRFSTDIGLIGSMCNLEILSFNYTKEIDVLPSDIGQLKKLKLLDLRGCEVGLVESGVLSSLTKLEELYMGDYFNKEGVEELNNGNCARVTELYSLTCLRSLQLCVSEPGLIMMLDFPGEELTRFNFSMSSYSENLYNGFTNEVNLNSVDLGKLSGSKFEALMRRAEVVSLRWVSGWKNIMRESDIDGYLNLKKLEVNKNDDLVEICNGNVPVGVMGKLEELSLSSLSAMMYIWRGRICPPCLINLKVFEIKECNAIRSLFLPSVVRCLLRLEVLEIYSCELLEEIISEDVAEDNGNANIITLPNLKNVKLDRLPCLGSHSGSVFSKVLLPGMETLTLGSIGGAVKVVNHEQMYSCLNLQKLRVWYCDAVEVLFDFEKVEEIPYGQVGENIMVLGQLDAIYIESLNELRDIWKNVPKQGFQGFHNLTLLDVSGCEKLKYLVSISMAKLLVNLQVINVRSCELMEYVIMIEEEKVSPQCEIERTDKIVFPNLFELNLNDLNSLKAFCQGSCDLEFPSLKKLSITDCLNMKKVSINNCLNLKKILSSETPTPNLEEVILPSLEDLTLRASSAVKIVGGEFQSGSFYNLRALIIDTCHSMEMLFDFEGVDVISDAHGVEVMVLGQLDAIKLKFLNELRDIWKNVPRQGFQGFHNLTKLDVYKCDKLRYLMSPCMAKLLVNLQVIKVDGCEKMEYVIMIEEESSSHTETEKNMDKIVFPRLQELKLKYLENLTAFCQGSYDLQFPSLKKVKIYVCSNMKRIFSSESPAHNFKEVILPSLETLSLVDMSAVKILVGGEFQSGSLYNLRALNIDDSDSMETLFDFEGVDAISREEVMFLGQLDAIKLQFLNELRDIWKNVPKQGFQGFHKLTVLDVSYCHNLRYLLSPCMAKLLVNLQVIKISSCHDMQNVIVTTEIEESSDSEMEKKMDKIVFPRLQELELQHLKNLTAFCQGSYDLQFPSLKKVEICECNNMERIFSSESPAHNFKEVKLPSLETLTLDDMSAVKIVGGEIQSGSLNSLRALNIDKCHSMETLFDFEGVAVISGEEVMVLGQLDAIKIKKLHNLRDVWKNVPKQGFQGFYKLTILNVSDCPNLTYLLSPCMAKLLVNLQVIKIENCEDMQYVIMTTEIEELSHSEIEKKMDKIVFPKLQELELHDLKNLTAFCQGSYDLQFPSLKKVEISVCSNMTRIFSSESPAQNFKEEVLLPSLETLTLNDMSAVKIVEIQSGSLNNLTALDVKNCDSLETLFDFEGVDVISGEEVMVLGELDAIKLEKLHKLREIWKNVPKQGFQDFHNLTVLDVDGCPNLRYLLSPCVAKLLVNLQVIKIIRCSKMEQVIQRDDEEEEKGRCGIQMNTIVFPCLREIHLSKLLGLKAFNEGSWDFGFPLLENLFIEECLNMNKFCSSSVSQPKLQDVQFEDSSVPLMVDLNTTIQLHMNELQEVILPSLETLTLHNKKIVKIVGGEIQGFQGFYKLTVLDVYKCHKLRYLLSPCMVKLLVNLQVIKVDSCEKMEYIIMIEEEESSSRCETEKRMDKIVFPRLQELELKYLKKLASFCQGSYDLQFPSLKNVSIKTCSYMKRIFCSESPADHNIQTLTLNNMSAVKLVGGEIQSGSLYNGNLRALNIDKCYSMETLFDFEGLDVISGEEVMVLGQLDAIKLVSLAKLRDIWKNVPKQGFQGFHNLTKLDVCRCKRLRYLLSHCMAKLLVNLQVISISKCVKMEEVIQRDDEEEEEEKGSCGIEMNTIVFPCLREIHLSRLSGLKAFHEGSCDFGFPLLDKLFIEECLNMNKFCSSSVNQPKLQHVLFEDSSVPLMVDLNTTIQNTLKSRQAGESSEPKMSQIHEEE